MKHLLFHSPSVLSYHMIKLVLGNIPRKIQTYHSKSIDELTSTDFEKTPQAILINDLAFQKPDEEKKLQEFLKQNPKWNETKKVIFKTGQKTSTNLSYDYSLNLPLLAEEFETVIKESLGIKA